MIRRALLGDVAAIAAIWNHYVRETIVTFLPDPKTLDDVAACLARETVFVHAGPDGADGFARSFPFRSGAGYRFTAELTVMLAPGGSGRGAGRALVAALEEAARAEGLHSLIGVVSGENAAGLAFHRRVGFAEIARLPQVGHKFGRWHDAVVMQKLL